ncbi:MAG TPA: ABC transporter permease [Planctomycetaceae bacterium]|nr:ABC transporter permease [Planctomycetaceae bacterium]
MTSAGRSASALPETVIRPVRGWRALGLGELWRQRDLVFLLAWRDVKVRYSQTALGVLWAILQPTLLMVVFAVFLGGPSGLPSGGLPYPLFVFAGLLPWTFFANSVSTAAGSVVASEKLVTKVYFPRLAIPFSAVAAAVVDFVLATGVLVALMLYYGIAPGWRLLAVPAALVPLALGALGFGVLLSALNVAYRDFRYVAGFLVQLWLFATPAVYMEQESTLEGGLPAAAATSEADGAKDSQEPGDAPSASPQREAVGRAPRLALLNPVNQCVAFFRAAVLDRPLPWTGLAWATAIVLPVFLGGCYYFRQVEDRFADTI